MDELSYIEKLENVYVLKETREMLLNKISITREDSVLFPVISNDLKKIEEELARYTNVPMDDLNLGDNFIIPNPKSFFEE